MDTIPRRQRRSHRPFRAERAISSGEGWTPGRERPRRRCVVPRRRTDRTRMAPPRAHPGGRGRARRSPGTLLLPSRRASRPARGALGHPAAPNVQCHRRVLDSPRPFRQLKDATQGRYRAVTFPPARAAGPLTPAARASSLRTLPIPRVSQSRVPDRPTRRVKRPSGDATAAPGGSVEQVVAQPPRHGRLGGPAGHRQQPGQTVQTGSRTQLMHYGIFLRLESFGLERVAGAALAAGHEVRVVDLHRPTSPRTPAHPAADRRTGTVPASPPPRRSCIMQK